MKKSVLALTATFAWLMLGPIGVAQAQVGKAVSEAADAVEHKVDEKRAENEAKKSGPVGKAVNKVKAGYHKKRSESSAAKAKKAVKNAG